MRVKLLIVLLVVEDPMDLRQEVAAQVRLAKAQAFGRSLSFIVGSLYNTV